MTELSEILSAIGDDPEHPSDAAIRREDVLRWMNASELEVQGAAFALLMREPHYSRIEPPLSFEDCHRFAMRYYERCFRENPDGDWADSRYSAGWSLVNWFRGLWFDSEVPRSALSELKDWIARVYLAGDEEIRTCLVTATLEHLLEEREIARFFEEWRSHEQLGEALRQAQEWQQHPRC